MNASPAQFKATGSGGEGSRLPANIRAGLQKIIGQDLRSRVAMFPVLLAIILPSMLLLQALLDRVFGLAWPVRLLFLLADVAVIGWLVYRHVYLPYKRKLNFSTAALLVERKLPEFRTSLISAVEFSSTTDGSRGMIDKLIASVRKRVEQIDIVRGVADNRELKRRAKWTVLTVVLFALAFWFFAPASLVLAQRILLLNVALPSMTKVVPLTQGLTAVAGTDVELSARAEGVVPRSGKLIVVYEDSRKESVSVLAQKEDAAVFAFTMKNVRQPFRYHFELNDGSGPDFPVTLKVVPSLGSITFTQSYPKYTGLPDAAMSPGSLSLLSGGKLKIKGESASELKSAVLELKGLDKKLPLKIGGPRQSEVETEIPIEAGLQGLSIHLEDQKGQYSENDPVYRVQLLNDKPPGVSLLEPKSDKLTVVVDDKTTISYMVRDDYGIDSMWIAYEVLRISPDGQLTGAEKGRVPLKIGTNQLSSRGSYIWDLATLVPSLTVGSAVSYWIEAKDKNDKDSVGTVKSKKKSLLVVSEEAKRAELLEAMDEKAKQIQKISEGQDTINQKTDDAIRSR